MQVSASYQPASRSRHRFGLVNCPSAASAMNGASQTLALGPIDRVLGPPALVEVLDRHRRVGTSLHESRSLISVPTACDCRQLCVCLSSAPPDMNFYLASWPISRCHVAESLARAHRLLPSLLSPSVTAPFQLETTHACSS